MISTLTGGEQYGILFPDGHVDTHDFIQSFAEAQNHCDELNKHLEHFNATPAVPCKRKVTVTNGEWVRA